MKPAALLVIIFASCNLWAQTRTPAPSYTASGELMRPSDYREWVFLSSGLGMTYGPAAEANRNTPMFDNVFVRPESYRAFLETGRWPDKTMFVLEIRQSASEGSINKGGRFQAETIRAIEVEVKDESRFPNKWAFFDFSGSNNSAKQITSNRCQECHSKNGAVDNTFVQFYPTLIEVAKRKGTFRAENSAAAPTAH